jgi:hypothetical protein
MVHKLFISLVLSVIISVNIFLKLLSILKVLNNLACECL